MKKLLGRLATGRAIGLLIGETELVVSLVAFTPIGPVEVRRVTEPLGDSPLEASLGRILGPLIESEPWKHAPLVVGLPVLRVFFSTRPVKSMNLDASPQILLHEVLQSSNLVIDDMEVDMIKSQPGKQPVASIIATRKKYLAPILEGLECCGVRPFQVEPAPFALMRAGQRRLRTPRGTKSLLRVFLGTESGLAILTGMDRPLAWRYFELAAGNEGDAIGAVVQSLRTLSRYYGVDEPPGIVIVHGRPDLPRFEETSEWVRNNLRVRRCEGPAFDDASIAYGLALGCNTEEEGLNLARSLRPRDSVLRLLPAGQMVLLALVLGGASFLLQDYQAGVNRKLKAVTVTQGRHAWLKDRSVGDLEKDKAALVQRAAAIHQYLKTGLLWTEYLAEISAQLPPEMTVSSLQGRVLMSEGRRARGSERQLELSMRAPISSTGAVPAEVDSYLAALRSSEVVRRGLPQIKLSALRWGSEEKTRRPLVAFTVTCQSEPPKRPTGSKS